MSKFIKRLLCWHPYWIDLEIIDELFYSNGKRKYECKNCGKVKSFRHAPVNYIGN